jgi:hypothetical protein
MPLERNLFMASPLAWAHKMLVMPKRPSPPGGSGPVIRTPQEMRAMDRAVNAGEAPGHGMDVWRPRTPEWARFEVHVYDVRFGTFIFHSYEGSLEQAKRTMASLRASRHLVRHCEVSHLQHQPDSIARGAERLGPPPDPRVLEMQQRVSELQSRLRHLWAIEGRPLRAMASSTDKLESLIGEAEQRMGLARQSSGG